MEKAINQRIKFLREQLNLSQYELSHKLKISQSRLARIELNKVEVEYPLITHIAYELGINRDWLLTGEGEMYMQKEEKKKDNPVPVVQVGYDGEENIVVVPVKAQAGYLQEYSNPEFIEKLPSFRLPGFADGTYRGFEIEGDSMFPNIKNGDWVICRFHEKQYLRTGEVYVLITRSDGIVCKRVQNHISKNGTIICISDNPIFEPYPIEVDNIMEAWWVKGVLTKSFNNLFGEVWAEFRTVKDFMEQIKKKLEL